MASGSTNTDYQYDLDDSTFEIDSPSVANDELIVETTPARQPVRGQAPATVEDELDYYRKKAIHQDILIFEMRALLQSGKGFGNILNLRELLDNFMAVVQEKYGAINSTVLLRDDLEPGQDFYRVRAFTGLESEFLMNDASSESLFMFKFPKDNGLLWQIIRQGNVFSVRDLQKDPRFDTAWRQWHLGILHSDLWCPLIKNGEVLGILTLGEKYDGRQISESEFPFLQELASIATTNIDSTLKYEKNHRILRNIQTLYDVNQQLANVNDFKRLCIETLSTAVDAVSAQKGNLMLLNKTTGKLEIKVVWGNIPRQVRDDINDGITTTKSFNIGEGIAGQCAAERRPIRKNDKKYIEQIGKNVVYCICCVPLMRGDEVEGVIALTNKVTTNEEGVRVLDQIGRFSEEDVSLCQGLADQAAVNLHKSRLYNKSITDEMTGLYNTRHFEDTLLSLMDEAAHTDKPLCLAVSDIDHFKKFNDTHGHKAGDAVLQTVARVMESCIRPGTGDLVFRYGGEEFCMLMPNTDPETAAELMELYRKRVESHIVTHDNKDMSVTVSIGISCAPRDSRNEKKLFERADECLYVAKDNGRNQVNTYFQGLKLRYGQKVDLTLLKQVMQDEKQDADSGDSPAKADAPAAQSSKPARKNKAKKAPTSDAQAGKNGNSNNAKRKD
jgi:diguanylate cyclase (GGDEF)-like protein